MGGIHLQFLILYPALKGFISLHVYIRIGKMCYPDSHTSGLLNHSQNKPMSWVLPSPSLGDASSTGPTTLWTDNSEMAAVVEVVFIHNEYILGKSTDELQTGE